MKDLPIPELIHVSTKYLFNIQATSSPGHKEYSQSGKSENQKKDSAPCAAEQREHSTQSTAPSCSEQRLIPPPLCAECRQNVYFTLIYSELI